jgi:hypothetical protein
MCLVYYCNKYEIIVCKGLRILYNTIFCLVYIIYFKYSNCSARKVGVFAFSCIGWLYHMFDNRELYLDIILDHRHSIWRAFRSRESMFIVYCLEFTHSRRDHKIFLFYSNFTSLHKEHPLGLRTDRIHFNTDNRKNLRSGRFLQRTERSVFSLPSLDVHWNLIQLLAWLM